MFRARAAIVVTVAACAHPRAGDHAEPPPDVVALEVLPYDEPARLMGFAMDDSEYLRAIPIEARTVPDGVLTGRFFYATDADYERSLDDPDVRVDAPGIVAFRSYEAAGDTEYVVRRVGRGASGPYEQWYLLDVSRYIRAVVSVHRETRRAYFFEIIGVDHNGQRRHFVKGGDHCYRCHPSGLRTVSPRPDDPLVDPVELAAFNRDVLAQGVVDFGADIDRVGLGEPIDACDDCHDGDTRGELYRVHHQVIRYRVETTAAMPPDAPMSASDAAVFMARICPSQRDCPIE